jgi:hypothetical protein
MACAGRVFPQVDLYALRALHAGQVDPAPMTA